MLNRRLIAIAAFVLAAAAPAAHADFINTTDNTVYTTFASGATVQSFSSIATLTPLALSSYANAFGGTTVPSTAELGSQISGLHFHSGGASFNDPVGNPGTPAAFLQLTGGIAGDAHSASNVVGSIQINTDTLDLGQFVEVIFTGGLQNRVGVWLNPALGDVTFSAFDSSGNQLETGTGTAGSFVGIKRTSNDIKFASIVGGTKGFTIDDLTYGTTGGTTNGGTSGGAVPEPGTMASVLLGLGMMGGLLARKRAARRWR
jgi:hypothetical protein